MTTSCSPRNIFQLLKKILSSDVSTCSERSELAQHTTVCSALAGAAHKSSHAPKKRLQTEASGHQPCNHSLLQNNFLLLKQSQWPDWSLKQEVWIQWEAQGTGFYGCLGFGLRFFLLQQRRFWDWQRPGLGLEAEWKTEKQQSFPSMVRSRFYSPKRRETLDARTENYQKITFWWERGACSWRALRRNQKAERQICSRQTWLNGAWQEQIRGPCQED